ncbi:MAG TPA: YkgJ family cysteine cluster protein [Kofleriaceae bacterium]|nr:YkgJ family cysteine cluster protein [Kofleriaceae bacterium]
MKADRERNARALVVLGRADRELAGWTCPRSAECCQLDRAGREPYLTLAEWQVIEAEVARQGRKLPAEREDGSCPFLAADQRCSIYAARPLGCRTYYCEKAAPAGPYPRTALGALVRDLEALAPGAERGRTLRSWLREARRRR